MNRRTFLRGAAAAAAAGTAGCNTGENGGASDPTIEALNRREEAVDVSLSLWRLGDADASCDDRPTTNGETAEATVESGARADLLPVTEEGTYGMVFRVGDERVDSCLEYGGSETELTWVVESDGVNFVTNSP